MINAVRYKILFRQKHQFVCSDLCENLEKLVTINVLSVESKHKGKYVFKRHRNPISYKVGIQEEPIKTKSILYFIFLFQI